VARDFPDAFSELRSTVCDMRSVMSSRLPLTDRCAARFAGEPAACYKDKARGTLKVDARKRYRRLYRAVREPGDWPNAGWGWGHAWAL